MAIVGWALSVGLFGISLWVAADAWAALRNPPDSDPPEPDAVDGVELPNVIHLRVQGGGLRSARARALEVERREWRTPA